VPADTLGRIYYDVDPLREIARKRIVIVGAGDAAFDYALNLAKRNHVTILNRSERVKCLPLLWEQAIANPGITYLPHTNISKITRESDDGLTLECTTPRDNLRVCAHYLIGALGREPQLGFVAAELREQFAQLQANGFLCVIGDAKNGVFRQTAIAVGDGILTGMKIYHRLKGAY
jgi:thioredoxin reductase